MKDMKEKRLSRRVARKIVKRFCGVDEMKLMPEVARDFKLLEDILCEPHYVPSFSLFEGSMWLQCDVNQFCEIAEQALKR